MGILYGESGTSESYQRYIICKEFGWDYYTYNNQPTFFIEEIMTIINLEVGKQKKEIKKQNRASLKRR